MKGAPMEKPSGDALRPVDAAPMAGLTAAVRRTTPRVEIDETDRKILDVLRDDARASQRHLAREVGMSAPAIGERVSRLERADVITGYTIDVDWGAMGVPVLVYIPMIIAPGSDLGVLLEQLRSIPELEDLSVITGGFDLMARMRLRDHAHLQEVLLERLWPIPGLQRVETFLSLGEVTGPDLLAHLLASKTPATDPA
jgi:DNA-binding Lrp family transcriptional regulator